MLFVFCEPFCFVTLKFIVACSVFVELLLGFVYNSDSQGIKLYKNHTIFIQNMY